MREIKFRAWDKINKRMLHFFLIDNTGAMFALKDANMPGGDDVGIMAMLPMRETVDLMQYTGLKDKNGRGIYEGDLIRLARSYPDAPLYHYEDGEIEQVSWNESGGFSPFSDNEDGLPYPIPEKCEVIGNIYENPELLK